MTAPNVATGKDRTSKLVTPPPSTPKTKPPTEAPAIPKMMVMTERPGSGPGTIRLAITPAMAPMTIQLMIPIAFLLSVSSFASCSVVWRRGIGSAFDCH
jgi:hypothetical protein